MLRSTLRANDMEVSKWEDVHISRQLAVCVDIAETVFQVHYIDRATGEIVNKQIKRAKFLEHFAYRAPAPYFRRIGP